VFLGKNSIRIGRIVLVANAKVPPPKDTFVLVRQVLEIALPSAFFIVFRIIQPLEKSRRTGKNTKKSSLKFSIKSENGRFGGNFVEF
jgi:hypothetical protein